MHAMREFSAISFLLCNLFVQTNAGSLKPFVLSSTKFMDHVPAYSHPECPERIEVTVATLETMRAKDLIRFENPSAIDNPELLQQARSIIENTHDRIYVQSVMDACSRGQRILSPWDEDTYISRKTFDTLLLAQSAWLQSVDNVLDSQKSSTDSSSISFAVTRPPGHHATFDSSMGFCIFNFAAGAAHYALTKYNLERIAILDYDVHFGNGVADLVKGNSRMRYASLHQEGMFPYGRGTIEERGDHNNILNAPLPMGTKGPLFVSTIKEKLLPFLKEFEPQLLIVCAGYDALASDDLAQLSLQPQDYGDIAQLLKDEFGHRIVFGLEGGYSLRDLPKAIEATLIPFTTL